MLELAELYKKLETVINERQEFEKSHSFEPFVDHKTDLNFPDIMGNTLLDYAVLMGDLSRVQMLVDKGADIQVSSLERAIVEGKQEITEFLFNREKLDLHNSLFFTANSTVKSWFHKKINEALEATYPLSPLKLYQKSTNQFFSVGEKYFYPLYRAAQIGNLDFINAFQKEHTFEFNYVVKEGFGLKDPILNIAAANGQLKVVEYLLNHGANIDSVELYQQSALNSAIINKQRETIQFLLEHGANYEWEDERKRTALLTAVLTKDTKTLELLLNKRANINHHDYDGRNVLHLAIIIGDLATITRLLQEKETQKLITTPDIYNFTPWDYAIQVGNEAIIKILKPESDLTTLRNLLSFGKPATPIAQSVLIDRMYYYLLLNYRDTKYLNRGGLCNGFEYLFQYYTARGMEGYFYDTLKMISEWDGQQSSLNKPFIDVPHAEGCDLYLMSTLPDVKDYPDKDSYIWIKNEQTLYYVRQNKLEKINLNSIEFFKKVIKHEKMQHLTAEEIEKHITLNGGHIPFIDVPQAKYYKNLGELMEQWINDVIWFQHTPSIGTITNLTQYQRVQQHTIISDDPDYKPVILYTLKWPSSKQHKDELLEYLKYFSRLPEDIRIEFGGVHATGGYINDKNEIIYYDPSFAYKSHLPKNYLQLFPHIIDYKYIFLEAIEKGDLLNFSVQLFHFKKDSINLKSNEIFSEEELPKNIKQAEDFQKNSPNRLTHLHIAVMTHSLKSLHRLLKDGYCDVNAVDKFKRTPLEIALEFKFDDAINSLLTHPELQLTGREIISALVGEQKTIVQSLLPKTSPEDLSKLFIEAIKKPDYDLVQQLIDENKADVNKPEPNLPLIVAIESGDEKMVELLLRNKASITKQVKIDYWNKPTPLSKIFKIDNPNPRIYELIISTLSNIDQYDDNNCNALSYAIGYNRKDLLRDLISRGANINLKDKSQKTALETKIKNQSRVDKEVLKVLYPHLKFTLFDKSDRKLLTSLIFISIKESDKEMLDLWLAKCNPQVLNGFNKDGLTALQYAVRNNQLGLVQTLIEAGADVDIKENKKAGMTCMHYMIKNNYDEKYFRLFLKHHTSLEIPDNYGKTALDYLAESTNESLKHMIIDELRTRQKPQSV